MIHPPPLLVRMYSAFVRLPDPKSGLTKLSFNPVTRALFKGMSDNVRVPMCGKYDIEVDPNEFAGRVLTLFRTNDPKVEGVVTALLRSGEVFLDIGANYSSIGFAAAECVGPTGAVHLFEPQPYLCRVVTAAIEASGLENVSLHPVGLMDRDDVLELSRPKHHSGKATFEQRSDTENWEHERLEVRKIDDYAGKLVAGRVFAAKVDVEGAEPFIVPWLVAQRNMAFLVFEALHHQPDLWQAVIDNGLTVFGLARSPLRMRVKHCARFEDLSAFHDVLAARLRPGAEIPSACHPSALQELLVRQP